MTSPPRLPGDLVGRYKALAVLGQGGFGSVIAARDRTLDREVAIKLLHADVADAESRARFDREARVTAALRHPHVVGVFDHGVAGDGTPFIVYELITGPTLLERLQSQPRLTVAELRRMGAAAADALQALHAQGVLHRDLKPANILLRGGREPVICDLGMARLRGGTTVQTSEGMVVGTPGFMAPEVWRGEVPGEASDQFSLGASLFQAAYLQVPYGSERPAEILGRLGRGWRPALAAGEARDGEGFADAVLRATDPDPGRRFADLSAMAAALRAAAPATPRAAETISMAADAARAPRLPAARTPRRDRRPGAAADATPRSRRVAGTPFPRPAPGAGGGRRLLVAGLLAGCLGLGFLGTPPTGPEVEAQAAAGPDRAARVEARRATVVGPLEDLAGFLAWDTTPPSMEMDRRHRSAEAMADPVFPVKLRRLLEATLAALKAAEDEPERWRLQVLVSGALLHLMREVRQLSHEAGDAVLLGAMNVRWSTEDTRPGWRQENRDRLLARLPEVRAHGMRFLEGLEALPDSTAVAALHIGFLGALYDEVVMPAARGRAFEATRAFDQRVRREDLRGERLWQAELALLELLRMYARKEREHCLEVAEVARHQLTRVLDPAHGLGRGQRVAGAVGFLRIFVALSRLCPRVDPVIADAVGAALDCLEEQAGGFTPGVLQQMHYDFVEREPALRQLPAETRARLDALVAQARRQAGGAPGR